VGSKTGHPLASRTEQWLALALCVAVAVAGTLEQFVGDRPTYAEAFAPDWLPLAAAGLAAAGTVMRSYGRPPWSRLERTLSWSGLLLMVWAAGGLPIDLGRIAGLAPSQVDWPGLATRTLALAAAVVLGHLALARPVAPAFTRAAWYGYAALALALPYPVLKTCWALGGTLGLMWPGAAGHVSDADALMRFALWLPSLPWLLAAALSLLLVSTWRRLPRRLLLAAAWFATAVVAMIGPAACWSLVTTMVAGGDPDAGEGIATWVFGLFYGSWLLWALAAGAATRSYQSRSAALQGRGEGARR
jgi:hypothetical protein